MGERIGIRKASEDDLNSLEHIKPVKEAGYFERCLEEQVAGKREIFIVTDEGKDAGYGILNWQPQYALYKKLDIPEIQDLNVLPEFRQRGLATALVQHCEDVAKATGRGQVGISVGLYKDYGPAQRLYVKCGYVPDGFGVTYDRQPVSPCEMRPVDDDLCLMLVKDLA